MSVGELMFSRQDAGRQELRNSFRNCGAETLRACMKLIIQAIDIYGAEPGIEQKHMLLKINKYFHVSGASIPKSILFGQVICTSEFGSI